MGNTRPSNIKRVVRELVNKYGDMFSDDFEHNKKMISKLTNVQTKKLRNTVAGYLTRYWRFKYKKKLQES